MKKAAPSILIAAILLAITVTAAEETPPWIGFLSTTSPFAIVDRVEAFRQGLRELGYVEGRNIVVHGGRIT